MDDCIDWNACPLSMRDTGPARPHVLPLAPELVEGKIATINRQLKGSAGHDTGTT
jgi:hypothetical protein